MEKPTSSFMVLMADDDEDDCLLVESAFQEMGIPHLHLRFVDDGRELLDYLHNEGDFADPEKYPRPNLILLDLNMPRKDGRKALIEIKSDPNLQHIPVLILTTSSEEKDVAFSMKGGANSFITKPASFEEWVEIMKSLAERWLR